MFREDPEREKRLIEKFKVQISSKPTLVYCFTNKLKYGCIYPIEIEEVLAKADMEPPPWWVDLLD